jgi:Protein phosphatase inhibitor 2 (IPP-2)
VDEGTDGGLEEERHKAFQALRKKHYEMKDAIKLGHQLEEEEEEDDDEPRRQGNGPQQTDKDLVNGHTTNT